jgi:hypothetical protein
VKHAVCRAKCGDSPYVAQFYLESWRATGEKK